MVEKQFILSVAKLVIAVGWADGELADQEVNALKDLLFLVSDLSGEEWHQLEIYMASPVSAEERERLLAEVVEGIRRPAEKRLVRETLTKLVEADGEVDSVEVAVLQHIHTDVEGAPTGLLAHVTQAVRGAVRKRNARATAGANREEKLDDYIKNRVFFHLMSDLDARGHAPHLPEEDIRKLCLAAGLMAQVAWIDSHISPDEQAMMAQILSAEWKLSEETAHLVVNISGNTAAKGLDQVRLMREFFDCTGEEERIRFIRGVFQVANACGKTSFDEIQAIQLIAKGLKVPHREFIEAKLTIPRQDRGGL